jgi:hypothetical protein
MRSGGDAEGCDAMNVAKAETTNNGTTRGNGTT